MSYCRWSSDDYRSDLYCYESSQGYETHVAGRRVPEDTPRVPAFGEVPNDEWLRLYRIQSDFLKNSDERIPIDLPHAGEFFIDETLAEFRERLLWLRSLGYRFPDYVFETINEDIASGEQ